MGEPRYRALLIGNAVFRRDPQGLPKLHGPRADVDALADALADPRSGLFAVEDIEPLIDRNLQHLREELHRFFIEDATRDDVLFLYYSGHGKLDLLGHLHLCASDTRVSALPVTALRYKEDIDSMIEASPASATVTVLDCCHSGAFRGGDLKVKATGSGRCVITSASASELALDTLGPNGMSPFTTALVTGLRFARADDQLTAQDLYDYVETELRPAGNASPQFYFDGEGAIVLAGRNIAPEDADSPPLDRVEQPTAMTADQHSEPTSTMVIGTTTHLHEISAQPSSVSQTPAAPEKHIGSVAFQLELPEPRTRMWQLLNEAASSTIPVSDDDLPRVAALCDIVGKAAKFDPKWSVAVIERLGEGPTRQAAVEALVSGLAERDFALASEYLRTLPLSEPEYVGGCLALIEASPESNLETAATLMLEVVEYSQTMPHTLQGARVLVRVMRIFAEAAGLAVGKEPLAIKDGASVLHRAAQDTYRAKDRLRSRFELALSDLVTDVAPQPQVETLQAHIAIGLSEFNPELAHGYFRIEGHFLPQSAFEPVSAAEIATAAAAMLQASPRTAHRLFEIAEWRCRSEKDWTDLFHALLALIESAPSAASAYVAELLEILERVVDEVPEWRMSWLSATAKKLAANGIPSAEDLLRLHPDERHGCRELIEAAREAIVSNPTAARSMAASAEYLIASLEDRLEQAFLLSKLTAVLAPIDLAHSLRLFSSMPKEDMRVAAEEVASALALFAPERIDEYIQDLRGRPEAASLIERAALGIAKKLPRHAVALVSDLEDSVGRDVVLENAVTAMLPEDLEEAEGTARSISNHPVSRASAMGLVAQAIAPSDPDRAAAIADAMPDERNCHRFKVAAYVAAAKAAAAKLPQQTDSFLMEAEQTARQMNDQVSVKCHALVMIAEAFADRAPMRTSQLLAEARSLASTIPPADAARLHHFFADLLIECAPFAPRFAEQLAAQLDRSGGKHNGTLLLAVKAMAATDPRRASELVKLIDHPGVRLAAQVEVVEPLSVVSPAKAERLALEMSPGKERAHALLVVAEALHRRQSGK